MMKLQRILATALLASAMALFSFPTMAKEKNEVVYTMSVDKYGSEEIIVGEHEGSTGDSADGMMYVFNTPALSINWATDISLELRGRELIRKSRI